MTSEIERAYDYVIKARNSVVDLENKLTGEAYLEHQALLNAMYLDLNKAHKLLLGNFGDD